MMYRWSRRPARRAIAPPPPAPRSACHVRTRRPERPADRLRDRQVPKVGPRFRRVEVQATYGSTGPADEAPIPPSRSMRPAAPSAASRTAEHVDPGLDDRRSALLDRRPDPLGAQDASVRRRRAPPRTCVRRCRAPRTGSVASLVDVGSLATAGPTTTPGRAFRRRSTSSASSASRRARPRRRPRRLRHERLVEQPSPADSRAVRHRPAPSRATALQLCRRRVHRLRRPPPRSRRNDRRSRRRPRSPPPVPRAWPPRQGPRPRQPLDAGREPFEGRAER